MFGNVQKGDNLIIYFWVDVQQKSSHWFNDNGLVVIKVNFEFVVGLHF